jgi:hypothetical protein
MKQTAVEWLEKELNYIEENAYTSYIDLKIKQAKEMEKKQLCYFYIKGAEAEMNNPCVTNIEFYNKTFKKTEQ